MTVCACGTPTHAGLCPHCDQPCTNQGCKVCRAIAYYTEAASKVLAARPHPTPEQLRDIPTRQGLYGRCPTCGTRTYDGWCPRPFCP